ncbi:MAG: hypothetical protein A2583_16605 [Bdellovibrionales bacterium RIFOXYD1_FULL_53_11]|nr:MAG: hypothetical protein A2583_16605 [Bdellovibrionales bacterium RIFOXYD1_FULL_53_11]
MDKPTHRHVYVLSDGTARTCEAVLLSVLCQFTDVSVSVHKVANIRNLDQLREVVEDAATNQGIVVFSFVTPQLVEAIYSQSIYYAVPTIDVLGHVFTRVENLLKVSPMGVPGLLRPVHDEYFRRIDSIDFAVKHDDGLGLSTIGEADVVLLGVSRSSKTPLSIYLSYRGIRAANVPIIAGQQLPKEVMDLPREKIVGLVIDHERLVVVRRNRFKGQAFVPPDYVDQKNVSEEITYASGIFKRLGCNQVDVTSRSIEEAATDIMNLMRIRAQV